MDDFYLGARAAGTVGRGTSRQPLIVAVERWAPGGGPGACSVRVVPDCSSGAWRAFCRARVSPLARVDTDGWAAAAAALDGWPRVAAGPMDPSSPGSWLRLAHRVISNLKAYVQGTFHGLPATRLQGAVDEFCWRYSHRAPGGPGIASELLGEAARGHVPRAELLSSAFAPQAERGRVPATAAAREENRRWLEAATAAAVRGRVANYAAR